MSLRIQNSAESMACVFEERLIESVLFTTNDTQTKNEILRMRRSMKIWAEPHESVAARNLAVRIEKPVDQEENPLAGRVYLLTNSKATRQNSLAA